MITCPEVNRILQNTEPQNVLHIYAQDTYHDDAQIVGTRDALTRLRDALDTVLQAESPHYKITCSADFFANDGEGYEVTVACFPDFMTANLPPPYTEMDRTADVSH